MTFLYARESQLARLVLTQQLDYYLLVQKFTQGPPLQLTALLSSLCQHRRSPNLILYLALVQTTNLAQRRLSAQKRKKSGQKIGNAKIVYLLFQRQSLVSFRL